MSIMLLQTLTYLEFVWNNLFSLNWKLFIKSVEKRLKNKLNSIVGPIISICVILRCIDL